MNYENFNFAFNKAFGHADNPGTAYERLRQKLIRFFVMNGHSIDAEDLTDDVIDRLLKRMGEGSVQIEDNTGVGRFALGVARNVNLEERRRKQRKQSELSSRAFQHNDFFMEERYAAFENCLKQLEPNDRKLLTEYYGVRHGETKRLALELGISHGKLRVQVHRLRKRLREMIDQYLNN